MTPDQPAVPPIPGVRVEFTWAATGGSPPESPPESAAVVWEHVIPPPEEICQVITALAQSADRYDLAADPEPGEPVLSPVDLCLRASCGHPRQHHPRNGSCNICAEGEGCAAFLDVPFRGGNHMHLVFGPDRMPAEGSG